MKCAVDVWQIATEDGSIDADKVKSTISEAIKEKNDPNWTSFDVDKLY
jgi:uncharacterized membrane-anchored protein